MPRLNFSYDLKDTITRTLKSAKTQEELEHNILQRVTKSADKIYAARFLDLEIKKTEKALKHLELTAKEHYAEVERQRTSDDPLIQLQNSISAWHASRGNSLNVLADQLQPGLKLFKSGEELYAEKVKKMQDNLNDTRLRLKVARDVLPLTPAEKNNVHPTLASLYREQVANRKWYQRGSIALFFSLILFPLAPIIYYLWKNERAKEMIQPNPHTMSEQNLIRRNRKAFKERANKDEPHFFTKKDRDVEYEMVPAYVTKYKLERDQFYSKARFFVSQGDISFIKASKERDDEFKLSISIR